MARFSRAESPPSETPSRARPGMMYPVTEFEDGSARLSNWRRTVSGTLIRM